MTDGGTIEARGVARLAEATGPTAKLEVTFAPAWLRWLPWVWAPYWVLDLGPDYSYALVGTPDRAYLWVLARTPFLDDASYSRVQATAREQGFDVARVVRSSPPVR